MAEKSHTDSLKRDSEGRRPVREVASLYLCNQGFNMGVNFVVNPSQIKKLKIFHLSS